jgi:tetratricopeptide (TPR) repeat protein
MSMSVEALRELGLSSHERGELTEAERCYREVLRVAPEDTEIAHALGALAVQRGRYGEAVQLIARVVNRGAGAGAHADMGDALFGLSRFEDAVRSYDRALALQGDLAAAHLNRGRALCGLGRRAEALASYERALIAWPQFYEAHLSRADTLRDLGRVHEALDGYSRALELRPDDSACHLQQARVLLELSRWEAALTSIDRAIRQGADPAEALTLRGVLLRRANRPADALAAYDAVLAMRADSYEARLNRAAVLTDLAKFEAALVDCDAALALQPDRPETYVHRAVALTGLERFEEALGSYGRGVEIRPDYAEAHAGVAGIFLHLQRPGQALPRADQAIALAPLLAAGHFNRGAALRDLQRIDEAVQSFETARSLQPDDPRTNANLGGLLLLLGRFEGAWDLYEWRSKMPGAPTLHRYPEPRWQGEDIRGKTLFLYIDQGLGDTIQFSRYAKLAELRGAHVVMSVQSGLRRLLSSLSPTIPILSETDVPDAFDHHCPLASLPRAFKTSPDTIPVGVPYLRAEPQRVAHWRRKLGTEGFKIGVCWQGSTVKTGVGRSFPLRELKAISSLPGVRLVSLQRDVGLEQLANRPADMRIETLGNDFDAGPDAFVDTAAVMESLDLVITCDTSIAHVAGALGRPAWVALKLVPDWRWMLDREDSPWYPSLRLFRQTHQGDWSDVFEAMQRELRVRIRASV